MIVQGFSQQNIRVKNQKKNSLNLKTKTAPFRDRNSENIKESNFSQTTYLKFIQIFQTKHNIYQK